MRDGLPPAGYGAKGAIERVSDSVAAGAAPTTE